MSLYRVLGLEPPPSTYSGAELKRAYRAALLKSHPDKASPEQSGNGKASESTEHVNRVIEAWTVLSSENAKRDYDRLLVQEAGTADASTAAHAHYEVDLDDMTFSLSASCYTRECRCGELDGYQVTEEQLEEGYDVIQCTACSSTIHINYARL